MPSRSPLLRPRAYFASHPDPLRAGVVVFVAYVLGSIVLLYALVRLLLARAEGLPPEGRDAIGQLFGTTAIAVVVLAVVSLLVVAACMHYLSGGDETDGTYGDAVAVAGWSYAPDVLSFPVDYLRARWLLADRTFDGSDPAAFAAEMEALEATSGAGDVLLPVAVVAWSVYVLAAGTAGSHDVPIGRTAGPALLVGVGSLVFRLL